MLETNNKYRGKLDNDDKFMLHLMQVARNDLGDRATALLDPRTETICLVSCRRGFLKWKGIEKSPEGDFYVRSGPGSIRLKPEDIPPYTAGRF